MPSSSRNKLKKLKKPPRKRVSSRTAMHSNQTSMIQTRPPTSRRSTDGHLSQILRKRRSNESFACVGASSPDLTVQQRFQTLHYDSLLKKAQTQKYHYLRHIDTLVQQAQPIESRPRRCILRSDLPVLKKRVRNKSMDEEVDMAYNVRWLRLVSEVERAVNTRPFKPIRPPLTPPATAAEPAPAVQQVDAVEDSYIPFPIPPAHPFSLVNKPPSKISKQPKTVRSSPPEVAEETSESVSDPARPGHHFDHPAASTRRSIPFQGGLNIRQSQELQVGRWDHLVQLERRAREASEEGMRKASLNTQSTVSSSTTSSLPQRKLSLLDRLRRPSTATRDSKSSLSISRPVPINSLFATEFAFENPDPTRSQAVLLPTLEEFSPCSSFVPSNLPPKILDESPRSAVFGASNCPGTLVKAIPKTEELGPSLQASSTGGGPFGARPPTSPRNTSIDDRIDNKLGISQTAPREETVSKDNNSKRILPEVFPLRVVKRSIRDTFQMAEPNHLENKPQEVFDTEPISSIPERLLLESVPESRESFESRPEVMLAYLTGSLDASTSTDDGNQNFRKFSSKEDFESLAQEPSGPDNKSDTPDAISTEPKSLNSISKSYFHVDFFGAPKPEENSPISLEMRTSSGPRLDVDVREEFGLHEKGERRRSSSLKSCHVTSSSQNTSTGNNLIQLDEISIPKTVDHPTHHRNRNAVIGLRLTGRQADHHSHGEEPRRQSSSDTGHSAEDCGHSSKQGVLQASSTQAHTDLQTGTQQNSVMKRWEVQQLPPREQELPLEIPLEVNLDVQNQDLNPSCDQNDVKERCTVTKRPVRYLTFELPVKPEKIIREKGGQKVEQAWASLSHYKRWTAVDRPNVEGVVRIVGDRRKNQSEI